MISISQVALLREETAAFEYGPMLRAVMLEIEAFYNRDAQRASFRRLFLSRGVPNLIPPQDRSPQAESTYFANHEHFWKEVRGSLTKTVDTAKILAELKAMLI